MLVCMYAVCDAPSCIYYVSIACVYVQVEELRTELSYVRDSREAELRSVRPYTILYYTILCYTTLYNTYVTYLLHLYT